MIGDLHRRNVRVMLSGANPRVDAKLRRAGIVSLAGEENVFGSFTAALEACRRLAEQDDVMASQAQVVLSETGRAMPPAI